MNNHKKAERYLAFFEQIKRGEDTITILKDNAPENLRNSVYKAHGDRLPNDWIFDKYESILDAILQYDESREFDDIRPEIVDGLVDIYTSNLTSWLNDNNNNVYYLSEALDEFQPADGFQALAMAQYQAIDEIFQEVASLLEMEDDEL